MPCLHEKDTGLLLDPLYHLLPGLDLLVGPDSRATRGRDTFWVDASGFGNDEPARHPLVVVLSNEICLGHAVHFNSMPCHWRVNDAMFEFQTGRTAERERRKDERVGVDGSRSSVRVQVAGDVFHAGFCLGHCFNSYKERDSMAMRGAEVGKVVKAEGEAIGGFSVSNFPGPLIL